MKLHIRHSGRSRTLDAEPLGLGPASDGPSVEEILRREGLLDPKSPVVVDRHPDAFVVRPPAVFG